MKVFDFACYCKDIIDLIAQMDPSDENKSTASSEPVAGGLSSLQSQMKMMQAMMMTMATQISTKTEEEKSIDQTFQVAGEIHKLFPEGMSNADKRRCLNLVAASMGCKIIPAGVSTGFSGGTRPFRGKQGGSNSHSGGSNKNPGNAPISKKGQAPPNPVKATPEWKRMVNERDALVGEIRQVDKVAQPVQHGQLLSKIRDIEIKMSLFKKSHGRQTLAPPLAQSSSSKA